MFRYLKQIPQQLQMSYVLMSLNLLKIKDKSFKKDPSDSKVKHTSKEFSKQISRVVFSSRVEDPISKISKPK